jgi:hypothetical protein
LLSITKLDSVFDKYNSIDEAAKSFWAHCKSACLKKL